MSHVINLFFFFFFNDTATTEIYTLSLHDALPISWAATVDRLPVRAPGRGRRAARPPARCGSERWARPARPSAPPRFRDSRAKRERVVSAAANPPAPAAGPATPAAAPAPPRSRRRRWPAA